MGIAAFTLPANAVYYNNGFWFIKEGTAAVTQQTLIEIVFTYGAGVAPVYSATKVRFFCVKSPSPEVEVEEEEEEETDLSHADLFNKHLPEKQTDVHVQHRQLDQPAYGRGGKFERGRRERERKKGGKATTRRTDNDSRSPPPPPTKKQKKLARLRRYRRRQRHHVPGDGRRSLLPLQHVAAAGPVWGRDRPGGRDQDGQPEPPAELQLRLLDALGTTLRQHPVVDGRHW